MARKFLTSIDLNKNEAQNIVIHVLAVAPTSPKQGQVYFNSVSERVMLRQASQWIDISGRLNDVLSGHSSITATDNGDGTVSIGALDATNSTSGFLSSVDKTKLDAATNESTPDTLVLRDENGDAVFRQLIIDEKITVPAPNDPTDAANKQYVDNAVTSGLRFLGTIDCSTNPDYPEAVSGDAYIAQPGGKIGGAAGMDVNQGDWIVCITDTVAGDEATVGDNWSVIEHNISDATESSSGVVRIATQAEVDAGLLDTALTITPKKLQARLDSFAPGSGAASYSADLGDGANVAFSINHSLNKLDVQMQLRDLASGAVVEPDFTVSDANSVLVEFNIAPTINQYRVVILG